MTFEDLPDNIRELPLDDPVLAADVVDLFVPVADRFDECLGAMACDDQLRGVQPIVVSSGGESIVADDVSRLVDTLARVLPEGSALLLSRGRPGSSQPTDEDRDCHQAAIDACRSHGIHLIGFHVATPDEVVALPAPLSATA